MGAKYVSSPSPLLDVELDPIRIDMYLIPRVLPPLVAQYISMKYCDYTWHPALAYAIYGTYCFLISTAFPTNINRLADTHGFLDGGVPRDNVPDEKVGSIVVRPLSPPILTHFKLILPSLLTSSFYSQPSSSGPP